MKTTTPTTTIGQDLDSAISDARARENAFFDSAPSTPVEKCAFAIANRFPSQAHLLAALTRAALGNSLSHAGDTVAGLAKNAICDRAIALLRRESKPMQPEELRAFALLEAVRFAKYGHHSTSPMSNIVAEAEASAWAEIAEICGGIKE